MGLAYSTLAQRDNITYLEQALACYQEASRFLTPDADPATYADIQNSLANVYVSLPSGDRTANMQLAITYTQEALRFFTLDTHPLSYAALQVNLGQIYSDLPTGNRTANLQQAIACYQEALRFETPDTHSLGYASTQNSLGNAYRDLPTGNRIANLRQAIACFEEALRFQPPDTDPSAYAGTQNNLAIAYRQLSQEEDRTTNLQRAFACYQEALHYLTPESEPQWYATTQSNLGNVYSDLLTEDAATNLQLAIDCYQKALHFQTLNADPLGYARTLFALGQAYEDLPTGDPSANLEQAQACYQQASLVWTPEVDQQQYADLQYQLGVAYYKLRRVDFNFAANAQQAKHCLEEALRIWSPDTNPSKYAVVQHTLGIIYEDFPGNATTNLQQAIAYCREALRFWRPDTHPSKYAVTQHNLGNMFLKLRIGERAANLEQAIACYQEALRFRTPENAPLEYALTQNSLGNAYRDLPTGDRTVNLEQAMTCYQEALLYFRPEVTPDECRMSNTNLAELCMIQGKWRAAYDAYLRAIETGEQLYRASYFIRSKRAVIAKNKGLHHGAAFAAVRCGEPIEALLILERGKSRLLAETLQLRVSCPENVPDEIWTKFESVSMFMRKVLSEEAILSVQGSDFVQVYTTHIQDIETTRVALAAAIDQVRIYCPKFLQELDLPTIYALLPDQSTVLVDFCFTDLGSLGFIIDHQNVRVVEVSTFTQADLGQLLFERHAAGTSPSGWISDYLDYRAHPTQDTFNIWQATMSKTLTEIGQRLLVPILSTLPSQVKQIVFLPSAELSLLPLHAVPLSDKERDQVGDRYQVSYAPSIEVLAGIQARPPQRTTPELYAAINPEDDPRLLFTFAEGPAIAKLFTRAELDEGRAGTKQRVITKVRGRTYVHFSCHGSYNWFKPTESGLALADGLLTLKDLQQGILDLSSVNLVTLSACETGIIDIFFGSVEEYVGIPTGFLLAGVPCVISSLWSVPDLSTALLMERFYSNHLKDGLNLAAALREAQIWVRELNAGDITNHMKRYYEQSNKIGKKKVDLFKQMLYYKYLSKQNPTMRPFAHPFYWAAFTVNGI